MSDPQASLPDARIRADELSVRPKTLALIAGGGVVAGSLIVLGAILPAEYDVDPLGIGRLTGLSRLWAPDEVAFKPSGGVPAHSSATPIQTHTVDIPLGASDWPEAALEYKVAMAPGHTILYSWTGRMADGSPLTVPLDFDFHGHTIADGEEMTVAEYRKASGAADTGALAAPFEGIHGWYFKNNAADPVIVRLQIEGFYTLVPPGQPGNEFSVRPLAPE
ncbi:MAG: hypothetical protein SGJ21_15860 [Alphaproteobacteria bacterium]|nr:hypothetical protein [Alphaproteobacteria bacterium]